jgi:uncharacterized protein (UPF0332 family)
MVIKFPIHPIDFMRIAEKLSNSSEESYFRTSVSRSYYSVFLEAREKLEARGVKFILKWPGEIHQQVILKLKQLKLGHIADKLDHLRNLRSKSDYFIKEIVDQAAARKALMLARYIYTKIQEDLS